MNIVSEALVHLCSRFYRATASSEDQTLTFCAAGQTLFNQSATVPPRKKSILDIYNWRP